MSQFTDKFIITANYIPKPSRRRGGQMISKVRFLVAHDTGNLNSTALGNVNFYKSTAHTVEMKKTASAHIFVDDKQIIECVPALTAPAEKALHVLKNVQTDSNLFGANANDAAIGVEYCYGNKINAEEAYARYVWVLAKLCFVFDLDPSRHIVGHHFLDPNRKTDPVTGLLHSRRSYDQLLRDVVLEYKECTNTILDKTIDSNDESGRAKVTVRLNVRKEPNKRSTVLRILAANEVVVFDAVVHNGEAVNNNSTWYRLTDGGFVWSGALRLSTVAEPV